MKTLKMKRIQNASELLGRCPSKRASGETLVICNLVLKFDWKGGGQGVRTSQIHLGKHEACQPTTELINRKTETADWFNPSHFLQLIG